MAGLYLDGINDLKRTLEDYSVESSTKCFDVKRDLYLKVTIFVHTALTLIRTTCVQAIRGTANIMGGLILLDAERVLMGLNDYFSLLIQAVALPILGVITFFLPKLGYHILHTICAYCDSPREFGTDIVYKREEKEKKGFGHDCRKGVSIAVMGVFGGITAFIYTFTMAIEQTLSLNCGEAWETMNEYGRLIAIAPANGFKSSSASSIERDIFRAHRMDIEVFNPSMLHY